MDNGAQGFGRTDPGVFGVHEFVVEPGLDWGPLASRSHSVAEQEAVKTRGCFLHPGWSGFDGHLE